MKQTLIFHGVRKNTTSFKLDLLIQKLHKQREYLHALPIDDLIDFFNQLTLYWQTKGLTKKYPYLKNITDFLSKKNLLPRLTIALHGNYKALDTFIDLGDPCFLFHAQPRGLTIQWLAGNVAILGLFSIFSALLTKNVSLIKASSRGYSDLIVFLETLSKISTKKISGKQLAQCIAVVLIDRTDTATHELLSLAGDVRVAWGGKDAVETIINLKKSIDCQDIIFGPKYSYALIDNETLTTHLMQSAQRLAIDVSVFDQYACSSPHTVFIQANKKQALQFAQILAKQLELVNRTLIPKGETSAAKAMEILDIRSEYAIKGKVFSSKGTDWTVVYTDEKGLFKGCFSRVIFVKTIKNIAKLTAYSNRQKQTLTVGMTLQNKLQYLDMITRTGIDRCPDLGFATFFESPWDGMFVFDRLVRWVTIHK